MGDESAIRLLLFSAITLPAITYAAWLLVKTKGKTIGGVVKSFGEIIAEAGEPSYEGRKATVTMNSLEDLAKVAESLAKPSSTPKRTKFTPTTCSTD